MEVGLIEGVITTTQHLVIFIALVVTFLYLLSLSEKVRKFIYKQEYSGKEKLAMILFFGFLGILASEYGVKLIGVVVNVRDCIAIFAGILGGPAVGIGAGLISGLYRMTGLFWKG
jgi:LytS/YehU family sensor histidine kinase